MLKINFQALFYSKIGLTHGDFELINLLTVQLSEGLHNGLLDLDRHLLFIMLLCMNT